MKIYKSSKELSKDIELLKSSGKTLGFVPTMGALHKGHLSLVKQAKQECDFVLVSIFVNPTQFNNPKDLEKYPRTLDIDLEKLRQADVEMVFTPDVKEIYPDDKAAKVEFDFGETDKVMEGKFRPGHFNGVAMVVKRLFEIAKPTKAYFGQKDIQQIAIINILNNKYLQDLNIEIVQCPIVREDDGLAMSSRNKLLTAEQRKKSVVISQALFEAKEKYNDYKVSEIEEEVKKSITSKTNFEVEYFEIVNAENLQKINAWNEADRILACIAVNVSDNLRLIDNIFLKG